MLLNNVPTIGVSGLKHKSTSLSSERLDDAYIDFSSKDMFSNLYSFKGQTTNVSVIKNEQKQNFVYTSNDITDDYQINIKPSNNNDVSSAWHMIIDNLEPLKDASGIQSDFKEGSYVEIGNEKVDLNALKVETVNNPDYTTATLVLTAGSTFGLNANAFKLKHDMKMTFNVPTAKENDNLKNVFSTFKSKLNQSKSSAALYLIPEMNAVIGLISGNEANVTIDMSYPVVTASQKDVDDFLGDAEQSDTKQISVKGSKLKSDITAEITDDNGVFSIDNTTISMSDAESENGKVINVSFKPELQGDYSAILTLKSNEVDDVVVTLKGHATATSYDLTIGNAQISTMYLDFPVSIPEDIWVVLSGNKIENGSLNCTPLRTVIPAHTGVIVQGNAGTYTFEKYRGDDVPEVTSVLHGVLDRTSVSDVCDKEGCSGVMTLGHGKSASYIGFFKYTGSMLSANKAYIPIGNSAAAAKELKITVDGGDATGIFDINTDKQHVDDAWYTTTGVRLDKRPTKSGVYINGGRKVIIK